MNINTKQLKSRLSLKQYEDIVNSLGIPLFQTSSTHWVYWTGDKNVDPYKGSPKLYFYTSSKTYFSYTASCSYDIIALVQKRKTLLGEQCSFMDAVNYILTVTGIDPKAYKPKSTYTYDWESSLGKFVRIKHGDSILTPYDDSIIDSLDDTIPIEWLDDGIGIDSMIKYHIGEYPVTNAITIPCYDQQGQLIGIRTRNRRPELVAQAKYIPLTLANGICYKFNTNDTFYGINYNWAEIERTGHVILVEGEKSVLKADTWWGEHNNVLALYGSQLGLKRMRDLIKLGVSHVTLALDSDFHEVGDSDYTLFEKKMLSLGKMFKGYCSVDVVYNNIGLKDWYKHSPFDGTEEQWNKLYEAREEIL